MKRPARTLGLMIAGVLAVVIVVAADVTYCSGPRPAHIVRLVVEPQPARTMRISWSVGGKSQPEFSYRGLYEYEIGADASDSVALVVKPLRPDDQANLGCWLYIDNQSKPRESKDPKTQPGSSCTLTAVVGRIP